VILVYRLARQGDLGGDLGIEDFEPGERQQPPAYAGVRELGVAHLMEDLLIFLSNRREKSTNTQLGWVSRYGATLEMGGYSSCPPIARGN
jgi:hypothetical protein